MKMRYMILAIAIVAMTVVGAWAGSAAYTEDISEKDLEFDKSTNGDVTVVVSYDYQLNDNYTTLALYHYLVDQDDTTDKIGTKTETYSSYVNGSSGTSGVVSNSASIIIDAADIPSTLIKDDEVVVYIKIYNGSVEVDNLIISEYVVDDWPYAAVSSAGAGSGSSTGYSTTTIALVFFAGGVVAMVVIIVLYKLLFGKKGYVP